MVYDPQNKPANPYAEAYKGFLEQTRDHTLTVVLDDGLNRQLRVGAPNTGIWSWGVATWPGYLATYGDIADGFMFTRNEDMMDFFDRRGHGGYYADGAPSIGFRYWAEKLSGGRSHEVREFSEDVFIQLVTEALDEHEELGAEAQAEHLKIVEVAQRICARNGADYDRYLFVLRTSNLAVDFDLDEDAADEAEYYGRPIPEQSPAERREAILAQARSHAENEHGAREWLQNHEDIFGTDAWWDWDLQDYKTHFLFACYAIELTVRLWRAYEASPAAAVHRNPGDTYIHVEGGIVQNEPAIPVFDEDVLDSDNPDTVSAEEARMLYEGILEHPQARHRLSYVLDKAAQFVRTFGAAGDIEVIEAHEAKRLAEQSEEKVA